MNKPIGVFDSGVGGLTVVKELIRRLKNEEIVYFGDTARLPYGSKSKETVIKFSLENLLFLLKRDVKLIVIACNTTSSLALGFIKKNFKIPIIDVIEPAVREAVYATKNKRIGIIGTRATIESRAYEKALRELDSSISVYAQSCPLFVPLVEEGWIEKESTLEIAREYLSSLKKRSIDTLILACTHYPLLKNIIQTIMGREVKLIDSAKQVALEVKRMLFQERIQGRKDNPRYHFFVSDEPKRFQELAKKFLGFNPSSVRKINV